MSPTLINNIYAKTKSLFTNNPGLTIKGLTIFFATTLVSLFAAGGVFLAYKKHKTPTQPKTIKL